MTIHKHIDFETPGFAELQSPPTDRPGYAAQVLDDAPVGYWRLGETSGTQATDHSGNGLHGSYVNAPTLGGPGALRFDANAAVSLAGPASAQHVRVDYDAALELTAGCSVEAWVRIPPVSANCLICGKDHTRAYVLHFQGATRKLSWWTGGANLLADADDLDDNTWRHVVGTTASSGQRTIFLDGQPLASAPGAVPLTDPAFLGIGRTGVLGGAAHLLGSVDEVAVYGHALPAARVLDHYRAGIGAPLP